VVGGKVEIEKHDSHFPTDPIACGARKELVYGIIQVLEIPEPRKEASSPDCSFFRLILR